MKTVNIHAAKTNLSKLIAEIEGGSGDIVIARAGKPVARLTTPVADESRPRLKLGMWKDKIKITGDIVSPIVEIWDGTAAEYKDLREDGTPYSPKPKRRPRKLGKKPKR